MEVWLVQPPIGGSQADLTPPLGILQLAAAVERAGHAAHVVDLNLDAKMGRLDPKKNLRTQFVQTLPKRSSAIDAIGITTWSYNFAVTMEFVEAIKKKHPRVPIVLGGPHVTFVDKDVLETFDDVDLVLRDEGDVTFPRLLEALRTGGRPDDLAAIPGLTWRRGGEVVKNPSGPVVEDLDGLPLPAYHLIDTREYLACQPTLVVEAGRGCPYNCNFCSTSNMFQRKYRVKSAPRLVDEVEWAVKKTGHSRFELLHDNLVASKAYVRELCAEIRKRCLDISWSCTSRTDNMTEDLAEDMLLAGCVSVFYGIESLDASRQEWTGKRLKPPLVEAAIELTARQHMTPSVGIIVGFPDETAAELDATVRAAVRWTTEPKIKAQVSTAALRFYPGADLFGQAALLRYDPAAARDNTSIPGYELREEWRPLTRLFPLAAIHTPPDETRRNLVKRNTVRVLLKACPQTWRGAIELLGLEPSALIDRLAVIPFDYLERPSHDLAWNETLRAFGAILEESKNGLLLELFACEVPFWRTTPVVGPLDRLEHVVHPKRYDHEALVAFAQRRRPELPPELEGTHILSIRGGRECVVWFTKDPGTTLAAFERSYAQDRAGTMEFLTGLRRGLS